jgi:hypothetical protein
MTLRLATGSGARPAPCTSLALVKRHDHDRDAESDQTERGAEGQPPGPPVTPKESPYDRLPEDEPQTGEESRPKPRD